MTAGVVLTGGASRRLGVDKAGLVLPDGETLAMRAWRLLGSACDPVVEAGPGRTPAPTVCEDPPGAGPVAALLAAVAVVGAPIVVLACDHPAMDAALIGRLADHDGDTLIPICGGRPQFVCARYGPEAIADLRGALERGDSSFRSLVLGPERMLSEARWRALAGPDTFADVDTAADAARFGIDLPASVLHLPE